MVGPPCELIWISRWGVRRLTEQLSHISEYLVSAPAQVDQSPPQHGDFTHEIREFLLSNVFERLHQSALLLPGRDGVEVACSRSPYGKLDQLRRSRGYLLRLRRGCGVPLWAVLRGGLAVELFLNGVQFLPEGFHLLRQDLCGRRRGFGCTGSW